jgi:tape measure domain-containing protein
VAEWDGLTPVGFRLTGEDDGTAAKQAATIEKLAKEMFEASKGAISLERATEIVTESQKKNTAATELSAKERRKYTDAARAAVKAMEEESVVLKTLNRDQAAHAASQPIQGQIRGWKQLSDSARDYFQLVANQAGFKIGQAGHVKFDDIDQMTRAISKFHSVEKQMATESVALHRKTAAEEKASASVAEKALNDRAAAGQRAIKARESEALAALNAQRRTDAALVASGKAAMAQRQADAIKALNVQKQLGAAMASDVSKQMNAQRQLGASMARDIDVEIKKRQQLQAQRARDAAAAVADAQKMAAAQEAAALQYVNAWKGPISRLTSMVNIVKLAFIGLSSSIALREIVKYGIEYNRIINTLSAGTGDIHKASIEFEFLKSVSRDLRVDLFAAADEYSKFVAAVKGTPIAGQQARDIFVALSKTTLVLGLSADRTQRAFLALQQMASQTYVTAENLRQQFAEHVPGAMIIAARAMGMTNDQFYKALYQGKILATDLLPKLAKALEQIYGPQAAAASQSMIGSVNQLKTEYELLMASISEGQAGGLIQGFMGSIAEFLKGLNESKAKLDELVRHVIAFGEAWLAAWAFEKIYAGLAKVLVAVKAISAVEAASMLGPLGAAGGIAIGAAMFERGNQDLVAKQYDDSIRSLTQGYQEFLGAAKGISDWSQAHKGEILPASTQLSQLEPIAKKAAAAVDSARQAIADMDSFATKLSPGERVGALYEKFSEKEKASFDMEFFGGNQPTKEQKSLTLDALKSNLTAILEDSSKWKKDLDVWVAALRISDYLTKDMGDNLAKAFDPKFKETLEALLAKLRVAKERVEKKEDPFQIYSAEYLNSAKNLAAQQFDKENFGSKFTAAQLATLRQITIEIAEQGVLGDRVADTRKRQLEFDTQDAAVWKKVNDDMLAGQATLDKIGSDIDELLANSSRDPLGAAFAAGEKAQNAYLMKLEEIKAANPLIAEQSIEAYKSMAAEIGAATEKLELMRLAKKHFDESTGGRMIEIWNEGLRDMQNTFSGFLQGIFTQGGNIWKRLMDQLKQMFIKMVADMVATWATGELAKTALTARAAAERAALESASSGGDYNAQGAAGMKAYFNTFKKLFSRGGSGSGASAGSMAGATGGAFGASGVAGAGAGSASAAGTGVGTITGTVGGGTGGAAAGGAGWASTAAMFLVPALMAAVVIWGRKNAKAKTFGSQSTVGLGDDGVLGALGGGKSAAAGNAVLSLLKNLSTAAGSFITGMDDVTVQVRNDGKRIQVKFKDQVYGDFMNMNDAVIFAAKKAFDSAKFGSAVDPLFKSMVKNWQGVDVEKLNQAAQLTKQILDGASGLSDLGIAIRDAIPSVHSMTQQLLDLGVSANDAAMLTEKFAGTTFLGLYRQITGKQETPAEELKRRKAEATLFNAQVAMYRLELMARKAYLTGQVEAAKAEIDLNKAKLGGQVAYLRGSAKVAEGELKLDKAKFEGDRAELLAQIALWEAELKIIDEVTDMLKDLNIDVDSLKIGDAGKNIGKAAGTLNSAADRWKTGVDNFINAIHEARLDESTSPLTERERLSTQVSDFLKLLSQAKGGNLTALDALPDSYKALLGSAKTFSAGGTGLGFLGIGGDTFKQFFNALESMSIDFIKSPRPKRIYEKNVVFDERLNKTEEESLKEKKKHRQENREQLGKIIMATQETAERTDDVAVAINRLARTAEQQWGAA